MDLRDHLQAALGSAYSIERELGGGGMSRVFVATETALGRKVVVKVLPPELTQGVSVERFRREIQLAAQLQHPHIVPVHASGETEGVPYYTMPLVDGTSLRERLATAGALPMSETINILREVAKALAYAHERGVVHRDIKPDNVLLTGGSAVVTDFGIAKALSASRMSAPGGTLTQIGTSLGTPAYMAPEQAAADPATDHRADIYSFGCMAYEMLAGRPPFVAKTPHKLLAAQMGEKPQPISELRADTPHLLAELVMRSLEKDPDHRPQAAIDLVKVLETVTTSGGAHPAMPEILLGGRPKLLRVFTVYVAAFAAAAILAKAAVVGIGLPTWVLPGTMIIMALGLPAILLTAFVHRGAHQAMTMAQLTPGGTPVAQSTMTRFAIKASPWVNWRRTTMGGAIALGAFALLVGGYMLSRAFGIGPAASLEAAGRLSESEKLLIADFKSPGSDTSLGSVVTEAFRSDIAQSIKLTVVQTTTVREALRRMQRPVDSPLDFTLARELATREGIKAVIDGEILSLGGGYVIAARLHAAQSGDVLATFRATAKESKDIITAIDELSRDVRAKIGESLKSVNAAPALEQVTTPSLEALKKYVQASRTLDAGGQFDKGIALLEEAIAIDTGFAMAYRKLSVALTNQGGFEERSRAAIQKAYDHRDRLSDVERYLTVGLYFSNGPAPDLEKSTAAYEALLDLQPTNATALINLANNFRFLRRYAEAEKLGHRAVVLGPLTGASFANLFYAQASLGKDDDARRTLSEFAQHLPGSPEPAFLSGLLLAAEGKYDSAEATLTGLRTASNDDITRFNATAVLVDLARSRGHVRDAARLAAEAGSIGTRLGITAAALNADIDAAMTQAWHLGDPTRALGMLDAGLASHPIDKIPAAERPYAMLARAYSFAGRPDRAKAMLAAFERAHPTWSLTDPIDRHTLRGDIAIAEHRYDDAIGEYRLADKISCHVCQLPDIARAYDLAGKRDSAIAILATYVETVPDGDRPPPDGWYLAGAHKRLGELYEAKGDKQNAATQYAKFIELWKNADPELQPKVAEVRKRLARLEESEKR